MGVNLGEIVSKKKIDISDLKGKSVAIDAYNALYQFLAIIRQRDGTSLKNSKGEITSHLSGLFYRSVNFIEQGISPIYVFDGNPPELKFQTIEKRKEIKEEARKLAIEDAKKKASEIATLLGVRIGNASGFTEEYDVPKFLLSDGSTTGSGANMEIVVRENKIEARVNVLYDIK